jgi:hypothetical protein
MWVFNMFLALAISFGAFALCISIAMKAEERKAAMRRKS